MSYELIGSYILYVFLAFFRTKDGPYVVPLLAAVVITTILSRRIGCFWYGYLLAELYLRKDGFAASTFIQHHGKKLQAACLICFMAVIAVITWIPHDDNALRLILAVILVTTVTFHPWLSACFQHPISLYLGRISFPLYLVHILVICSWSSYGYLHLPTYGLGHAWVIAIIVSSTILISFGLAHMLLPLETFATRSSSWIGKQSCRLVWK